MDGQQGHKNSSMSLNSRGSATAYDYDFSYGYNRNPVIPMAAETGRTQTNNHPSPLSMSLSQWIECPQTPHGYFEFLRENIEKVPSADVLESIGSPVGGIRAIDEISQIQSELLHNNAGNGKAFSSGLDDYPIESEHGKLKLSAAHTINPCNHEASASGIFLRPHDRPSVNRFSSFGFESHAQQNHTHLKQEGNEYDCKVFQLQAKETMSAPSFLCQPHHCVPKPKAAGSDRQRRLRIAESVRALQELLPNSAERDQATALDDIIDHIKFLQFQIKESSRSRLGGEPASIPFDYFEGYGHYSLHEQTMNESLEEMMGKLLEINPLAATQLFERKGLYMMPWTLVDGLHRAA